MVQFLEQSQPYDCQYTGLFYIRNYIPIDIHYSPTLESASLKDLKNSFNPQADLLLKIWQISLS